MTFIEMLRNRWQKANSMVCVGLDSEYAKIPELAKEGISIFEAIKGFNMSIVSATREYVCAYKPNIAFYEEQWLEGLRALEETIAYIRAVAPGVPIILDAKRTDIGNTNKGYAKMAFDVLKVDAITVNPYFGGEALGPFLERTDKGIIILCRTSNKGAREFQDLSVTIDEGVVPGIECTTLPLYQLVAHRAATEWNKNGNCLLVVGATYPEELKEVRKIVGDMPILVPGIGAQKDDLEATVKAGLDSTGFGMIINSARGIIFADKEDIIGGAEREAKKLRDQINEVKASIVEEKEVLKIFEEMGAIITGSHIVYTSGKHGSAYVNKDAIYPSTKRTKALCEEIAAHFVGPTREVIEVVAGPAVGGVILAQWVASALNKYAPFTKVPEVLAVYAEDGSDDTKIFKRGYDKLIPGKKVLVVEDVLTTGGSVKKLIDSVKTLGGKVVGVGVLCNRGGIKPEDVGAPEIFALTDVPLEAFEEEECPFCKAGVPINTEVGKGREFLAKKAGK